MTNWLDTYFPTYSEIPATKLAEVRARAVQYLMLYFPNEDPAPGSNFGDLVVTPFTFLLAATEIAGDRFMSDMDLENIAAGIIWNCDFAGKLVANSAATERPTMAAYGIVRLTFSTDAPVYLDRNVRFKFRENIFRMRLHYPGGMLVGAVGSPLQPESNQVNLVETAPGVYQVDLYVESEAALSSEVTAGDTAEIAPEIPDNLNLIEALNDFQDGTQAETLPALAKKARETVYSATPNTAIGAERFLLREFPDTKRASAVVSGNREMLRDTQNALGIQEGKLDLYCRGKAFGAAASVTVVLPFIIQQENFSVNRFVGQIRFPAIPARVTKIQCLENTAVSFPLDDVDNIVFSRSADAVKAPLLSSAYSPLEEYWFSLKMPAHPVTGVPLITTNLDSDGVQYATFKIDYIYDPLVQAAYDLMLSRPYAPIGVDCLVKGFVPVVFDRFTIRYYRQKGTELRLEQAKQEILAYVNTAAGANRYTDSRVYDSVFYAAGAYAGGAQVEEIQVHGKVQWTIGTRVLPTTATLPTADHAEAIAASLPLPVIEVISSGSGMIPEFQDANLGTAEETLAAVGARNVAYILPEDVISFQEIATV